MLSTLIGPEMPHRSYSRAVSLEATNMKTDIARPNLQQDSEEYWYGYILIMPLVKARIFSSKSIRALEAEISEKYYVVIIIYEHSDVYYATNVLHTPLYSIEYMR